MMKTEELKLTREWDKTFPKSDKVEHCKVTFVNHFGIKNRLCFTGRYETVAGNLFHGGGIEVVKVTIIDGAVQKTYRKQTAFCL